MGPCKHIAPSPVLANEGCRLQWLGTKPQQPAASQKTPNCMQSMESSPEKYCPKTAKSLHCSFPKDEYLTKMLLTPVIHSVHLTLLCQRFQQRPARAMTRYDFCIFLADFKSLTKAVGFALLAACASPMATRTGRGTRESPGKMTSKLSVSVTSKAFYTPRWVLNWVLNFWVS